MPPGSLFMLGDNPDRSYDSRQAGYFSADALLGIVVRRLAVSTASVRRQRR